MNVKSFMNGDGVPVNVDLDLVEAVEEAADGRAVAHFGPVRVALGVPYGDFLPEVTAKTYRKIPQAPPPPPPADNNNNGGQENGGDGNGNP